MTTLTTSTSANEPISSAFEPVMLIEIEIGEPIAAITNHPSTTGCLYRIARALVRLHTQPLGIVDLSLSEHGLSSEDCAKQLWFQLQEQINTHLRQDGLEAVIALSTAGLASTAPTRCLEARIQVLAEAPFASIIVCTRDRPEHLADSLRALSTLDYPSYELIIVDNAPRTSATVDLVQQQYSDMPHIRYVREDRPGLSIARNTGLRYAQGAIVAFTDDDAIADKHWLTELVRHFQSNPSIACVTGLTLAAELETQAQAWFEQFGGFNRHTAFETESFTPERKQAQRAIDPLYPYTAHNFGAGVNMAFRTDILRLLDAFDPALGAGSPAAGAEDIDAFFRIVSAGYTLIVAPTAIIRHVHRRDYAGLRKQLYSYGIAFSAFITRCVIDKPTRLIELVATIPYVLYYLLNPRSPKHVKKEHSFPKDLVWVEFRGLCVGPLIYLWSRKRLHRINQEPHMHQSQPSGYQAG